MAITGNIPLTVEFRDTSTGENLTYLWDFGDGQISKDQNPSHEYNVAGDYTVSLTTSNNYGSDVTTDTVSVTSSTTNGGDGDFGGVRDTGGRDTGGRDTGGRDTGGRDTGGVGGVGGVGGR